MTEGRVEEEDEGAGFTRLVTMRPLKEGNHDPYARTCTSTGQAHYGITLGRYHDSTALPLLHLLDFTLNVSLKVNHNSKLTGLDFQCP
jgi:hypothetical protein